VATSREARTNNGKTCCDGGSYNTDEQAASLTPYDDPISKAVYFYCRSVAQNNCTIDKAIESVQLLIRHRLLERDGKGQTRHGSGVLSIKKQPAYNEMVAQSSIGFVTGQIRKKALEAYTLSYDEDFEASIAELADCIGYAIFAMQYLADQYNMGIEEPIHNGLDLNDDA